MHGPLNAVLLLDNRDSFVWNLAQALQTLGQDVHVARSDAVDVGQIEADPPKALVVSPGPGRPDDAGCSVAAIRALSGHLPILGVCLGHQALAVAFGGSVFRSPPCHGKPWPIHHDGGGLFARLPNPVWACRYHSLAVCRDDLPDELRIDAWSEEGLIMAVRHRQHPTFGLQFHPESFRTERGIDLLASFTEVIAA